jgi:hypothetical protein
MQRSEADFTLENKRMRTCYANANGSAASVIHLPSI